MFISVLLYQFLYLFVFSEYNLRLPMYQNSWAFVYASKGMWMSRTFWGNIAATPPLIVRAPKLQLIDIYEDLQTDRAW